MEKFTEFHVGKNKIALSDANYLVSAYKVGNKMKLVTVPVKLNIFLDMKIRLTSLRDLLIVDSMIYRVSVGDYSMAFDSLHKAEKGVKKIENEHVASLFGARP